MNAMEMIEARKELINYYLDVDYVSEPYVIREGIAQATDESILRRIERIWGIEAFKEMIK